MWWEFLGWFFVALFVLFVILLWLINGITTKLEIPEQDEYNLTGVYNAKQHNEDNNSDDDANGLRSKFNGESG